jgi:hypothetical protein
MVVKFNLIVLPLAVAVLSAGVFTSGPAAAQQVGTATAVNQSTESTSPGGSTIALTVGSRILHNQNIHTSPNGSVQLLFLDKSTLNIAPNTNIVIDEFVFDPASGSGHMLTKLTQGTLQYIGGKLSHQGAVTITTPAAAIGIRGGINITHYDAQNGTQTTNLNGQTTATNGTGSIIINRPGFTVTILNWNTPPGQPTRVTEAQINQYIEYLSSKFHQNGGVPGLKTIDTANFTCGTILSLPCPQPPWLPTNAGEDIALQIIIQSTQRATLPTEPPPPQFLTGKPATAP